MFIHSRTVIGVFVDDLLVAGNSVDEITKVREQMNKRFVLTDQENWNIISKLKYLN